MLLKNSNKNVILFDVNYYMQRNYHGRPESYSVHGHEAHMFHGTIQMLKKEIKQLKPDHYVFCFDGDHNFRKVLYPEYKEGRKEKTQSYLEQEKDLIEYLRASGAPVYRNVSYEADDLIASFIFSLQKENYNFYIASKDKDLSQLLSSNVFMLKTERNPETGEQYEIIDSKKIYEKFGVSPEQIVLFLTLMGDKSDNLKFLQNIGVVTASKIVNNFSSLNDIVKNLDEDVIINFKEQILNNLDKLYLAETLINLCHIKNFSAEDLLVNKEAKDKNKMDYLMNQKYLMR